MPLIYFLPPLATVLIWSGNMTINQLTVGAIAPSSIAFLRWLLALLERAGCELFDCQFMTGHLASLGAIPIPQSEYLERLAAAQGQQRLSLPEALAEVQAEAAQSSSSPGKLIAQLLTQTS